MEKIRTVCTIYKKGDLYDAYYFKEFFKWIGFSYYHCSCDEKNDNNIVERLEGNNFDLFLCLNYEKEEWIEELKQKMNSSAVYRISTQEDGTLGALQHLFSQLGKDFFPEETQTELSLLFEKMIDIYDKYNMVNLLYSYSFILLNGLPDERVVEMKNSYLAILDELESLDTDVIKDDVGREYYLYAKLYAQANCGILYQRLKMVLDFGIEERLNTINSIYQYDPHFYRAEYLKTRFALLDERFRMYVPDYLRACINQCDIKICKSFYYYSLGKELELQHKNLLSLEAYLTSNKFHPYNVKALFKIALERYRAQDLDNAKKYLTQILIILDMGNLEDWKFLSLMDIEYIFKCAMIMAKHSISPLKEQYYEMALKLSDYIAGNHDEDFVQKLYKNDEGFILNIREAMAKRFKRRRLDLFKNI